MSKPRRLEPEELAWSCGTERFRFETTDDIEPLAGIIGQERALRSLDFGLDLENHGYNIYVLGERGTGRESTVRAMLEKKAASEKVPDDWCYVNNFSDPDRPIALRFPPGEGSGFKAAMESLIAALRRDIPSVFESKDYERHRDEVLEGQQERTKSVIERLEKLAESKGFVLKKSSSGLAVLPAGKDGEPMKQEEYEALPREKKEGVEATMAFLQDRLGDAIREVKRIERETRERLEELDREVVRYVVNPLFADLEGKYRERPEVVAYLEAAKEDVLGNIDDFRPKEELSLPIPGLKLQRPEPSFGRYQVNLFVNNGGTEGAPVVFETNPTYSNLFGKLEYRFQFGVASTDFTMIKAGAVHRANGGYLVVHALDMLRNIFVYDSLKRLIKSREARIEDVWEQYRLVSASTLKPAPIPVDIKIVVIGEPYIYYLLYNLDDEYKKLFKVKADFDTVMDRTDENIDKYAAFVAACCRAEELPPFTAGAVARVVEHGCRLAGDKEKLSARFNEVQNLVVEAGYWAGRAGAGRVEAHHVDRARSEKVYRDSKIEDKLREYIKDDTIMVSTEGSVVGQVNGIAVLDLGDYRFGKPSRITTKTFMGDSGVVNIEREVKMSGRIHNKALMILTSYLGEKFARDFPLTLSASVCFEQLYEEVEGDSATCTEVYALVSSLAGVGLAQGIAVTGSMNQRGEVQPVGGINEKIEGFFDVCRVKGLTGGQGVIIPRRNVRNLMLRSDVVEAVRRGEFSIYPVAYVDEGLEILTGMEAGERGPDGAFPEGSVNRLVEDRLRELALGYKAFGRPRRSAGEGEGDDNNSG
ncbi:MAG TPA: ATP-dependent protease [Deltaproteobacteria bacterium]|nr:ATP-dependent protease [Deltaproteobacteria bacterium]